MKWLKSTTQKTWYANGKKIPQCITPNNEYLQLEDADYAALEKMPVIASLIHAGGILVLSEEPAELKNSVEVLQGDKAALVAKNTELEARVKELEAQASQAGDAAPVDVDAIKEEAVAELKAEAVAELQKKDDEIAELRKQLKAAEKKAKASADE